MINLLKVVLISITLVLSACSDDDPVAPTDPQPEPLNAKAGLNQEAEINETVTLDGSQSTGPSGFTYSWSYEGDVPEEEINFQNKTSAKPTFVPPSNNLYEFTLTIAHGDSSDLDETTVLVGGAIELGGTLTKDLELKNIQHEDSKPDYIVTSDLIVPNGLMLSIIENNVVIEFVPESGIHVQEGGIFTNTSINEAYGYTTELYNENGWKGILIEGGTLSLSRALIINAGNSVFDGQTEAAAISFVGNLSTIQSLSDNEFVNSNSYDILAIDRVTGPLFPIKRNRFSYTIPIKSQIRFMELWTTDHPNIMPDDYDYIQLIPSGAERKDETNNNSGFSFFPRGAKFYIDGDFWAGSDINVGDNSIIYMKENSGILVDERLTSRSGSLITGLDGKTWKGIAASKASRGFKLDGSTIENAGYGRIVMGSLAARADAAVYWSGDGNIALNHLSNSTIKNSGGYGYYDATSDLTYTRIENSLFQEIAISAIKTNVRSVGYMISSENHGNRFELDSEVAAVFVQGDGSAQNTWYSLGTDDFYLIDADFIPTSYGWEIEEGVHLKFDKDRFFNWNPENREQWLKIRGTSENPVIIEGQEDSPGSWGGAYLKGLYIVTHTTFKNGGAFPLADDLASQTANVVTAYNGFYEESALLQNCTFENSSGYGLIVAPLSLDYKWEDSKWSNTFTNNASGDVLVIP